MKKRIDKRIMIGEGERSEEKNVVGRILEKNDWWEVEIEVGDEREDGWIRKEKELEEDEEELRIEKGNRIVKRKNFEGEEWMERDLEMIEDEIVDLIVSMKMGERMDLR